MTESAPPKSDDLVSVAEASDALGVTEPQVHNLCRQVGGLEKIAPPAGRKNHPAGAAVITRASLERLVRERSPAPNRSDAGTDGTLRDRPSSRDQAAALALKVQLDEAREAARADRARTREVLKLLKGAVAALEGSVDAQDALDKQNEQLANVLGLYLTPEDASGVDEQPRSDLAPKRR